MDLCDYLNESQAEAVAYCDGPELVIAGAGSGKTRVLTYKVAYLIEEKGYLPYNILALTFTNKAANEMKSRIADIVGAERAKQLWMGTFHSIFLKILKIEHEAIGFSADLIVYDTSDSKSMIHSIIKEMGLDDKTYKPGVVLGRISNAKNHLISPSAYENNYDLINADRGAGLGALCRIYRTYWDRCKASGIMDFDDILVYTYILLSSNEEIADKYRRRFKYILVDEYQDTNFVQHSIMLQLTKSHHNICVVGDDAQSIYSFRGANIENILSFRESYPETKLFKLECNYRSTGYIVDAANSLIANNRKQLKKKVFSNREMGNPIAVMPAYSDIEEGMIVAHKVKSLCRKGYGYKDCAILYRTNAQSRIFEETLRKFSIPYKIYGGLSFYHRKEIKDVTAYFRFVCNHYDEEAFRRIINYPKRGIGPATVNNIFNIAGDNRVGVWDVITDIDSYAPDMSKATKTKIKSFADMITGMSEFVDNAYEAIAQLLKLYEQATQKRKGVHPLAYVDATAVIGEDCYVAPFAYVGEGVVVGRGTQLYSHVVVEAGARVGEDCLFYPNVTVYHGCVIGNRVTLHAGCVIGADGFGFAPTPDGYDKIPQIGIVTLEDDVEIGANTCVDRSTMGSTVVRRGVKLDNLVQVAHNCEIGEHTVMSAQVGVAGSTKIGRWCMFGGQVGIAGHSVLGDQVRSGAQAGIAGSLRKGHVTVQGSPAIDAKVFARASVVFKKLPELYAELNRLKEEVDALSKRQ